MREQSRSVVVLLVIIIGVGLGRAQAISDRSVVRLDPSLDSFVSPEAKLEIVKSGFGFTEGINWVPEGKSGFLVFSDLTAQVVDKMTPDGEVSVLVEKSGYHGPDGLAFDRQGRLIICTYGGRSVERLEKNGQHTVLADRYNGKRFSGPNDVVVKKDGAIYFADTLPLMPSPDRDPSRDLESAGVYMVKDGKVTLVVNDLPNANGLAFSPGEKYLYANGSSLGNNIRRYEVNPDDTVKNGKLLIDLGGDKTTGYTDGMKVDAKGNIYSTGPGGIWIISRDGKHLGTILTPQLASNLAFGDPDHKTLYITARTTIYKIRLNTAGQQ